MPTTPTKIEPDEVRLLSAAEAASLIGVQPQTVKNWHRFDRLRGVRAGREIRWRQGDVLRFAASLRPAD